MLSMFQPIGVVLCSGITYGLVPKYSCGDGANGKPLPACSKVASGEACCTKMSNMGWRYTLIVLGAICLAIFFLRFVVFDFQESPKFLLYRGHDEKAVAVLHKIAKFNHRESGITIEAFEALNSEDASMAHTDTATPTLGAGATQLKATFGEKLKMELQRYKLLFSNFNMARLTILIWLTYMFDYWGFSIAGEVSHRAILYEQQR